MNFAISGVLWKQLIEKKKSHILVVDDSRSARELIKNFLENEGYVVTLATDGKEAVKIFRGGSFDLVLMDANMPVVDGYRASAEIRRSVNGGDASIIMITSANDDKSVENAFAAGAEEYITKPIRWVVLQHRIRLILNHRFAQEAVAEGRARMEAIVNTAADAIIVINHLGCIESINLAAERLFGYLSHDVLGQNISMFMPSPYRAHHDAYLAAYQQVKSGKSLGETKELLGVRRDGVIFPIELTLSEVKLKDRLLFTGIVRDITARKEAEAQIYYQANYDALTGVANRSLFMKTLAQEVETANQSRQIVGLIFVDLDRFKWVNDTLGHGAGDELLKAAAQRMSESLRELDTVARLGGDEFTLILPNMPQEAVILVARRILQSLNESFLLAGEPTYISGSLGVAFFPQDATELDGLLKCADEAMYRSKKAGRNACHVYAGDSFILQGNY